MRPFYEDEAVTLYCGDCRDVLPTLAPVDLILTDPPYGIYACGGKWGRKSDLQWDRAPIDDIAAICAAGREQIIWGGNYYALPPSRGWLVWFKRDSVPTAASVELAWTSFDMNARLIDHTIAATNAERVGHPTQKPERVMAWSLGFAPNAQTILDPFAGSGTTLVAAKRLGRKAIGIELSPAYCDVIVSRLRQGSLLGGAA